MKTHRPKVLARIILDMTSLHTYAWRLTLQINRRIQKNVNQRLAKPQRNKKYLLQQMHRENFDRLDQKILQYTSKLVDFVRPAVLESNSWSDSQRVIADAKSIPTTRTPWHDRRLSRNTHTHTHTRVGLTHPFNVPNNVHLSQNPLWVKYDVRVRKSIHLTGEIPQGRHQPVTCQL